MIINHGKMLTTSPDILNNILMVIKRGVIGILRHNHYVLQIDRYVNELFCI